ncbi:MAG: Mechanosensitive ion channel-domain-containing protein [Monoraphidium minutum]|nr:MAG: Mechanosensitive ion channel-domain-containing protein [Monoraphidium minutum]
MGLLLLSLRTPAYYMLPPLMAAYVARAALNIFDLALRLKLALPPVAASALRAVVPHMLQIDAALTAVLQTLAYVFAAWFFIQLKDTLVSEAILVRAIRSGRTELERLLLPLSTLLTWGVVVGTAVTLVQQTLGLNLKPLLALGGVGGIAAGFASQQVLQNAVSGINLFLSRPFVVGEQVVLSGGGCDVAGVVEGVDVLRTQLRTYQGVVVALPNNRVADMVRAHLVTSVCTPHPTPRLATPPNPKRWTQQVIFNKSRSLMGPRREERTPGAPGAVEPPLQRVLTFTAKVGRDKEHQIAEIRSEITACLGEIIDLERAAATAALLQPHSSADDDEDKVAAAAAAAAAAGGGQSAAAGGGESVAEQLGQGEGEESDDDMSPDDAAEAAAALIRSPAAALAAAAEAHRSENSEDATSSGDLLAPRPPVFVTLQRLTEESIELFVKAELLVVASGPIDAEHKVEAALIRASQMVRERYGGTVVSECPVG